MCINKFSPHTFILLHHFPPFFTKGYGKAPTSTNDTHLYGKHGEYLKHDMENPRTPEMYPKQEYGPVPNLVEVKAEEDTVLVFDRPGVCSSHRRETTPPASNASFRTATRSALRSTR